jgi:hypothetical protein
MILKDYHHGPVNMEIKLARVHVQVREGPDLGIMDTADALGEAGRRDLDLVLSAPLAKPPLCEIMDMSRCIYNDELAAQAGKAPPPRAESIPNLPIPSDAKALLAGTGLPTRFPEYHFDYDRIGVVRLDVYVEWWREIEKVAFANTCRRLGRQPVMWRDFVMPHLVNSSHFYRIGEEDDLVRTVCVEADSGRIFLIDIAGLDAYDPPVFINSDVVRFAEFIKIVTSIENDNQCATLRSHLTALDPKAMEDRDQGFWPPVVKEFEEGMWTS